jgi:SAM-dependent methyltransferase
MNWTKNVAEYLQNKCFYNDGLPFTRSSDLFIVEKLKEEYHSGKSLLDYACGTGRFLDILQRAGINPEPFDYLGYDKSNAMLETAERNFPGHSFDNQIKTSSDYRFDIVICNDMLQHSKDFRDFASKFDHVRYLGKLVFFHFWYEDERRYQELTIENEKFDEFFPSKKDIEDIMYSITGNVEYFPEEKPYKCCVIVIDNRELQSEEEAKAPPKAKKGKKSVPEEPEEIF